MPVLLSFILSTAITLGGNPTIFPAITVWVQFCKETSVLFDDFSIPVLAFTGSHLSQPNVYMVPYYLVCILQLVYFFHQLVHMDMVCGCAQCKVF